MVNTTENNQVIYDSLTEKEKTNLRQKCIDDILGNDFEIFCPLSCLESLFCINKNDINDSLCNDSVIKLMDKLNDNCKIHRLFYGNFEDEEIQKQYEMINNNDSTNIENINIFLAGQVFIRVVSNNQKLMLPSKINNELLDSYVHYNPTKQKKIVKRIPFLVNLQNRRFLISLQTLFRKIEEESKLNKTSRNDLLHIFGPIVFKGFLDKKQVHGFHRMVILEDVLKLDFNMVDSEIYYE